jgi:dipeptidyl aminopeptidase/acylaminoacyl peptidase
MAYQGMEILGREQSQHMLAALDKTGIEASLLLLAGQGHGFSGAEDRLAWDTAKAFLDRHLLNEH